MNIFWLSVALLLWGLVHSLLASLEAKALARRLLGPLADRVYRLAYNLFSLASLLPVAWLLVSLPDRALYTVKYPWSLLMQFGQLLALLTLALGLLQTGVFSFLGLSQLGSVAREAPQLVTGGLYRFVRHPLYAAGLLFIWLSPGMTANRFTLVVAATVYIVIGASFEERKLRREYGDAYRQYAAVTPMLIPFSKGNKSRS
jgi:protein-S-isoprenylcysteine O-methyltransferase Ste14